MFLKNEKGFTLVELMVGMIVLSFFMLGTYVFSHSMLTFSNQGNARAEMQRQGTLALEYTIRGIREADNNIVVYDFEGGAQNGISVTTANGVFNYWSEVTPADTTREDNMYMNLCSGGGCDEILIGDYMEGGFSIKVNTLAFVDNFDGVDPTTNTVNISLSLNLMDLKSNPAELLETMNFNAEVQPRNR